MLFLEGGTTSALAQLLNQRRDLHVITNNLMALADLALIPEGRITMLGGDLRSSSMSAYGVAAQAALEHLSADKVFLSGRAWALRSQLRAYLKETMIARAAHLYVLADTAKLGRARQQHWTPLRQPWTLITQELDELPLLTRFQARRSIAVEVVRF